ncbi:MAG: DUF1003 domain-containing protein [Candidatus Promineofilum sp.]|nr:DUF1003 domain-containing protein [Promineifilum sp.]MCW5864550.1 DUF1003 domain-containing protein [Anaerolineae bacterium]
MIDDSNRESHSYSEAEMYRRSLKGRADAKRTFAEVVADKLTLAFGSMIFLVVNVVWFGIWIIINVGLIPGIKPFDPFPFGFLTMVVSLEAIALAIIVLISQNRAAKIADLREEVDLHIDMMAEAELTKLLQLVTRLAEEQGINLSDDRELQEMLEPSDTERLQRALEDDINNKPSRRQPARARRHRFRRRTMRVRPPSG